MAGQINLTLSIVMIALFSIAIIGFCVGFANDNDAYMSVADDPNVSSLQTNLKVGTDTFKDDSSGTVTSLLESTVEPGSDVIQSTGPFAITASNLMGTLTNVVFLPYHTIFGTGVGFGIFFTTLGVFISFMFILFIIKTWKGNP